MKSINNFIIEKLKITSNTKINKSNNIRDIFNDIKFNIIKDKKLFDHFNNSLAFGEETAYNGPNDFPKFIQDEEDKEIEKPIAKLYINHTFKKNHNKNVIQYHSSVICDNSKLYKKVIDDLIDNIENTLKENNIKFEIERHQNSWGLMIDIIIK